MEKIAVVNFGSQYTHLIARRIRELNVYSEIINYDEVDRILMDKDFKGVVLSGGPSSVDDPNSPKISKKFIEELIESGRKILAICYSHQLIAYLFGARLLKGKEREFGPALFEKLINSKLFEGLPKKFRVWVSHNDSVADVPDGFIHTGRTYGCRIASMESEDGTIYTLQFHPEVVHTEYGTEIFNNFIKMLNIKREWILEDIVRCEISRLRKRIGNKKVVMAASGGVDSTVAAMIIKEAIGDAIYLVHIDTGLLRENESEEVVSTLRELGFNNIIFVNARDRFLKALRGLTDPEEKRKAFSRVYFEILKEEFEKLNEKVGDVEFIAQGTIYPDTIETGKAQKKADRIKSHHNVVLAHMLSMELIEPLRDFYKDEVRKIGEILGVPDRVIKRKPFPGPGLLVRILGEIDEEKIEIIRKAHKIVEEEAENEDFYDKLWQIFPVLLDSKSVGVMGDRRKYGYIIALRAVLSEDGMTAEFAKLPWDFLERVASRLTNEIDDVVRVVYDITNKPPSTIEFE